MVAAKSPGEPYRRETRDDGDALRATEPSQEGRGGQLGGDPRPHQPADRRDGQDLPHHRGEDASPGGEEARRADPRPGAQGRRSRQQPHAARLPHPLRGLQAGVRHHRALHRARLPRRGGHHQPLHRRRAPGLAHHRRRERLHGPHERRRLRAQVGRQALPPAQAGAQVGAGAGPRGQEPLRLLQAAQAREDAHQRPVHQGPHADAAPGCGLAAPAPRRGH